MNLIEISEKFPTELDCIIHFENIRWGDVPKCAYCSSLKLSKRKPDNRFNCKSCNKSFSVKVNTNIHNTRLPLKIWLYAIAVITDAKKGLSAMQLQRNLGIHYETAWKIYMKLRELMEEQLDQFEGIVEMDETYVGGKPRKARRNKEPVGNISHYDKTLVSLKRKGFLFKEGKYKKPYRKDKPKRGRGTLKIPVVGIVERSGNVIAEVMKHTSYKNIKKMVQKYVSEEDSVLVTDSYKAYDKISEIIDHVKIDHQEMFSYRGINSNSIESFWAIIKRGIIGQYHQVSPKYLPMYVTEFVFKYNNRNEDDMFETLVNRLMEDRTV